MSEAWHHGKWAGKEAYWHDLNEYITIVIRASDYNPESKWKLRIHVGNLSWFVGEFKRDQLEWAKNTGVTVVQEFLKELAA